MAGKMTTCKHCGAEIAAGAKVCPQCGGKNKKPLYKRPWFIILIVVILLGAVGSAGGGDKEPQEGVTTAGSQSMAPQAGDAQSSEEPQEPEIVYTPYEVQTLMDDLQENALKAAQTYKDQYVELTGDLNVVDSSGKYISITPSGDQFAFIGVQCYLKSDEQRDVVMNSAIGDRLTVKGKITSVGEVMGYSLDIDEISKAE